MLSFVASYHCIQLYGKLMSSAWEKRRKPSFWPNFGPFGPIFHPQIFFSSILPKLDVKNFASYHCMQFQGKLMNKTGENGKKPSFKSNFGPFGPYSGRQFFFQNLTLSVTRYYNYHHYVRYQKSLIIQSWENLSVGQTDGQTDRWTEGRTKVIS